MSEMERRAAERAGITVPIELVVIGQPLAFDETSGDPIERAAFSRQMRGEKIEATLLDISINGCRVGAERFPPVLTRVSVKFNLPTYGEVEGVALVMWRRVVPYEYSKNGHKFLREAGFGLVFESLSLEARTAIAKLVAERT
ncbi:MAG: PilZ domain-containing protein [Myxococcaceae bacterium]